MISWVKSEEIISMGDQLFDKVKHQQVTLVYHKLNKYDNSVNFLPSPVASSLAPRPILNDCRKENEPVWTLLEANQLSQSLL